MRQKIPMSIKLHKSPLNVADFLNVMKRADVCKYRQAVKTMQCEKKKKTSKLTYILFKFGKRQTGKHPTSAHQKMASNNESILIHFLL